MNLYYKDNLYKGNLYSKLLLPLGSIHGELYLYNEFFQKEEKVKFKCLIGDLNDELIIFDDLRIGSYKLDKHKVYSHDLLNLHKKRVKKVNSSLFTKLPSTYNFQGYEQYQSLIKEYTHNNSDEYEIKEYIIGDSIKDIHYKISYKLSKLMIKDKINEIKDIHLFLDLSGDEDEIIKVFSYLYCFIEGIESSNKKCLVHWYSKDKCCIYTLNKINDFNEFITYVLSMPKALKNEPINNCWIITKDGIDGGDYYEE